MVKHKYYYFDCNGTGVKEHMQLENTHVMPS